MVEAHHYKLVQPENILECQCQAKLDMSQSLCLVEQLNAIYTLQWSCTQEFPCRAKMESITTHRQCYRQRGRGLHLHAAACFKANLTCTFATSVLGTSCAHVQGITIASASSTPSAMI